MAKFHDMNPEALTSFLLSRGYYCDQRASTFELVYKRQSKRDPNVWIKVYTSISVKQGTRWCGTDAIRVCVVWDNGERSFGIGRFRKVLRTTSDEAIIERVNDRLRAAATRANQWIDQPT